MLLGVIMLLRVILLLGVVDLNASK